MAPSDFQIGIVGVGRMGANMARRLHDLRYAIVAGVDRDAPMIEKAGSACGSH